MGQEMKMKRKILYVSRAGLPLNAPGIRIFNVGNILEKRGAEIHYISASRATARELDSGYTLASLNDHSFLRASEVNFEVGNKIYSYLPELSTGKIGAAKELLELVFAKKLMKRVCAYCESEDPCAIILYNDVYSLTKQLIPYCKKKGIKLFADVTEWYEYNKNDSLTNKIVSKMTDRRIRKLDHKLDGVIAISSFFEDYYKGKGQRSINLPPVAEIDCELEIKKHEYYPENRVINFVYAGSPASKDIIFPFIDAVKRINKESIRIRVDLIGIDESYLRKSCGCEFDPKEKGIVAHGRLPHGETLQIVRQADFGFLFRRDLRYAKAGFSTKFTECMSVGVAMMCNEIGGTERAIEDMHNGILTKTAQTDELYDVLKKLITLSDEEILRIRKNAYEYAKEHFAPEIYVETLNAFLETT